ncbi:DUF952 domain-containing protein [Sediminibacterium soli]|uniref:DUF952 domain-containing protein n=1 Tax=Sediminibacterium soli TaxID=2698829 RepID=UPI00137A3EA2|nr:DUF952 domain-containing protein [Sediminibacterium soli]NCI45935.1 DUF952 domain-containing protein [Sediminibacterium soli]
MNHPRYIYHITTAEKWTAAQLTGQYEADSLQTEGFIHCSTEEQLAGVLQRYYQGKKGLLQLQIDSRLLVSELRYELSPSIGQEFPHIYGSLNISAIVSVTQI